MLNLYKDEQPIVYKILSKAVLNDKLSHAYIFETRGYFKALDLAKAFVSLIECSSGLDDACGTCDTCIQIKSDCFLDLKIIDPVGLNIKKEETDLLQFEFSMKPVFGKKKIYIINQAEKLNPSSSNSLLKFIEEPVDNIIAILITENSYNLLNTITSRCQLIQFKRYSETNINNNLMSRVAKVLFNDESKIEEFVNNDINLEKINAMISFFSFLEKNKRDALLFSEKYFHAHFKTRDDLYQFAELAIVLYQDILNFKLGRKMNVFEINDKIRVIETIKDSSQIGKTLSILIEAKDKIKYNVNSKLFIDKLIVNITEV